MTSPHQPPTGQLDLFSAGGRAAPPRAPAAPRPPCLVPAELDDAALVAALPDARRADCRALAAEAGQRKLTAAIPALAGLCRRFKGFGLTRAVPEQLAALQALAAIGGRHAAEAVARLIVEDVVQGPGLAEAVCAAANLGCGFPPDRMAALLRHADPAVRADACRCARPSPEVIAVLASLLDDLHADVADAAACALGRMRRPEVRPALLRLLQLRPTPEAIEAMAAVADASCVILLGRLARTRPELAGAVLTALDDIDTPQAAALAASLGRASLGRASLGRDCRDPA